MGVDWDEISEYYVRAQELGEQQLMPLDNAKNPKGSKDNPNSNGRMCIKCKGTGHKPTLHGRAHFIVPTYILDDYYLGRKFTDLLDEMGYVTADLNGKSYFYPGVEWMEGLNDFAVISISSQDIINLFNRFRALCDKQHPNAGYARLLARGYSGLLERLVFDSIFARNEMVIDADGGIVEHLLLSAGDTDLDDDDYSMLAFIDAKLNNSIVVTQGPGRLIELDDSPVSESPITGVKP